VSSFEIIPLTLLAYYDYSCVEMMVVGRGGGWGVGRLGVSGGEGGGGVLTGHYGSVISTWESNSHIQ